MPVIHTSRLPEYLHAVVASNGDFRAPAVAERFLPLTLAFDTVVDQSLSPYSDAYFAQQLALYREISGRELDQASGELHPGDLDRLLTTPNPLGMPDVAEVGEHVRSVSTMLSLASLNGSARVLDLGAGHGLSSEVFAFAGAQVHAVDIDRDLGAIARQRAHGRHLSIVREDMNFDDVAAVRGGPFDAAFFFQSFHHCLKPWKLIADIEPHLAEEAVIGFTGEPMQTLWWRNWGLRLDHVSIFVARHLGWFESGWSHAFIADCFARNGMVLDFYTGGHAGGEIGMATASPLKRAAIAEKALVYGPYVGASAGRYEFAVMLTKDGGAGSIVLDVVSASRGLSFYDERCRFGRGRGAALPWRVRVDRGGRRSRGARSRKRRRRLDRVVPDDPTGGG